MSSTSKVIDVSGDFMELMDRVIGVRRHYEIWEVLRQRWLAGEVRHHPMFFEMTICAHFSAFISELFTLYDDDLSRSISWTIDRWLGAGKIDSVKASMLKERIRSQETRVKHLENIRHRVIAHRSQKYHWIRTLQQVDLDVLKTLQEETWIIVQEIAVDWGNMVEPWNDPHHEETNSVLSDLDNYHEQLGQQTFTRAKQDQRAE